MTHVADWTFAPVADSFDDYVRTQLPFYDLATTALVDIIRRHLPPGGRVVDIGASLGNVGRAAAGVLRDRDAELIAIEIDPEMAARYRGPGTVVCADAVDYDIPACDVIVSNLTLAFIPPHRRADLLPRWIEALRPGGALALVERCRVSNTSLNRELIQSAKARKGATETAIVDKEVALSGVLRPVAPELIERTGASLFFAYGDFRGYVVEVSE